MMESERLEQKAYSCAVSAVSANYNIKNGEQYRMHVPVMVCYMETENSEPNFKVYYCGIMKENGRYYIYDYD